MDSDKRSAVGRRRRWFEDEKLKIVLERLTVAAPGRSEGAAIRCFALVAAPMATIISPRAEG
jgi:hypothetical protein